MLILKRPALKYSDVTPEALYLNRRGFLGALGVAAFPKLRNSVFSGKETPNSWEDVTHYNNYYEFGTRKNQPVELAKNFRTDPWTLSVEGEVKKAHKYSTDDLMKLATAEERIYRFRCVEGWSMVVPWAGYSLSELIRRAEPTSKAKYVAFETCYDPAQMPEAVHAGIELPYREGLRLDEAMHPLTMLTFGMYGKPLPPQDGAPVRLIVPWKYGFKSAKSLVKISLVEERPRTAWNIRKANEYGFYANVNPTVDHPRWSQATERRLGEFLRKPTLMFNGYAEEVGSLYKGMDLKQNY
jgi:sulfoxide reductase catalytic subunit YedY